MTVSVKNETLRLTQTVITNQLHHNALAPVWTATPMTMRVRTDPNKATKIAIVPGWLAEYPHT